MLGLSTFTAFTKIPLVVLKSYDYLIAAMLPLCLIFESIQPVCLIFCISRFLTNWINYDGGFLQVWSIIFLVLSIFSIGFICYYLLEIYRLENVFLITKIGFSFLGLLLGGMIIASSVMSDTSDSNLLNGLIPALLIIRLVYIYLMMKNIPPPEPISYLTGIQASFSSFVSNLY